MDKRKFIKKEVEKKVREFGMLLKSNGIRVVKIIIFGSSVKGSDKEFSDIDVCVVAKEFGKDEIKEMAYLLSQARLVDTRIEPIPYSPNAIEDSDDPLAYEINKYGKVVFSSRT